MISFKFKLISTVEVGTKGQVPRQFIATQCIKKGFTNSIDHVLIPGSTEIWIIWNQQDSAHFKYQIDSTIHFRVDFIHSHNKLEKQLFWIEFQWC